GCSLFAFAEGRERDEERAQENVRGGGFLAPAAMREWRRMSMQSRAKGKRKRRINHGEMAPKRNTNRPTFCSIQAREFVYFAGEKKDLFM
ncbi:hypothetical protein, partial [Porphyromonas loveana]|uniref:hypothetical protein n=1 Tax=Porphyromonas loveana TaxID=1884669 RepID=UPI0035A1BC6C